MTKIMLVEDDKSLREIYGVRLLAEGYDIVSAGDGEEALAMAIKDRPDLIVSDVMMPKISGFDMLDILRSTTETKDIKVIMMTALSSEEQRKRGEQLGADMYLVKSQVGIEDVVKAVHQVLGDKPGAAPAAAATPPPAPAPAAPPTPNPAAAVPTPPPPAPDKPVNDLGGAPTQNANTTTIPEPTAPFTGDRPSSLGERVIQPLKDNPRVANVDVGELIDKEFSSSIQNIENVPDGASSAVPPAEEGVAPDASAMPNPTPSAPASDDGIMPTLPTPPAPANTPAPVIDTADPSTDTTTPTPDPVPQAASPDGHIDTPIVPPAR